MGHSINAIILKGDYDKREAVKYDLIGLELKYDLTLFYINNAFVAYWQKKMKIRGYLNTNCNDVTWYPRDLVIYKLMKAISRVNQVEFALILTNYFGGVGTQYSNIFKGKENVNLEINTISKSLNYLGVEKGNHNDEFEAIGLQKYRTNPDYLDKYDELANDLGV